MATLTSNGSASDVQAKINSAVDGDTVTIPAGTFDWGNKASVVTISGKSLTLKGNGIGSSIIKTALPGPSFYGVLKLTANSKASSRITGLTFAGKWSLLAEASAADKPFRVDNCYFDGGTAQSITMVSLSGNGPGLFQHCSFKAGGAAEMVHNNAVGNGNGAGWSDDISPGSYKMVIFEDCEWFTTDGDVYASGLQGYYGARTCIRHSVFNNTQIDQHGNSGNPAGAPPHGKNGAQWGSRWFEFYNNIFKNVGPAYQGAVMALRDGSGVVFGNSTESFIGQGWYSLAQDEGTAFDGSGGNFVSGLSYPITCQIGRGRNQKRSPVYLWNNSSPQGTGSNSKYVTKMASALADSGDFYISDAQPPKMLRAQQAADGEGVQYSYTPFVYPYPLDAAGLPNPGGEPTPPDPIIPPDPIPPDPAKATYQNWLNELGQWIQEHPAKPDQP